MYTTKSSKALAFLYKEAARLRGEVRDWEGYSENSLNHNERDFCRYAAQVYTQLAEVVEGHIKNCHEVGETSLDKIGYSVTTAGSGDEEL